MSSPLQVSCAPAALYAASAWQALGAWRVTGDAAPAGVRVLLEDPSRTLHEALVQARGNAWQVQVGERSFSFAARLDGERLEVEHAGRSAAYRFLRAIEQAVGRPRFDAFARSSASSRHAFNRPALVPKWKNMVAWL